MDKLDAFCEIQENHVFQIRFYEQVIGMILQVHREAKCKRPDKSKN
jgi:hypothetical protein